jgi:hypothetical protein
MSEEGTVQAGRSLRCSPEVATSPQNQHFIAGPAMPTAKDAGGPDKAAAIEKPRSGKSARSGFGLMEDYSQETNDYGRQYGCQSGHI